MWAVSSIRCIPFPYCNSPTVAFVFLLRLLRDFNSWTKKDYPVILIKAGLQAQMFCLMMVIISQESHVVFNQTPAVVGHIHGKWESVNETLLQSKPRSCDYYNGPPADHHKTRINRKITQPIQCAQFQSKKTFKRKDRQEWNCDSRGYDKPKRHSRGGYGPAESFIAKLYSVPSTTQRRTVRMPKSQMLKIIACEFAVLLSSARKDPSPRTLQLVQPASQHTRHLLRFPVNLSLHAPS